MKYYDKNFLDSGKFYSIYYLPKITLKGYIDRTMVFNGYVKSLEEVQSYHKNICDEFFEENIMFYDELSKYVLNRNGDIKPLDEYIFMKLRYYATKFLNVVNEADDFFKEEIIRFKKNGYDTSLIELARSNFHDYEAQFSIEGDKVIAEFDGNRKFEFYGVDNWVKPRFLSLNPTIVEEEIFEKGEGIFQYNILWYHADFEGCNYSESSMEFTKVKEVL